MTHPELKKVNEAFDGEKVKTIEDALIRLKTFKGWEFSTTEEVLKQIADELRFAPEVNPLFITEVNFFLHRLHRMIGNTDYYDSISDDMDKICILSMHLSKSLKEAEKKAKGKKTPSKSLINDMKTIGKILTRIAPSIRSISGIIMLLEKSDIQLFG